MPNKDFPAAGFHISVRREKAEWAPDHPGDGVPFIVTRAILFHRCSFSSPAFPIRIR